MAQYRHQNRHIDQWNGRKRPEINPHIYGRLTFNKDAKNTHTQWGKDNVFSNQCAEKTGRLPTEEHSPRYKNQLKR
jgi:hypothetical protein